VPLDDLSNWWRWVPGGELATSGRARHRHPRTGSLSGRPGVLGTTRASTRAGLASVSRPKPSGSTRRAEASKGSDSSGATSSGRAESTRPTRSRDISRSDPCRKTATSADRRSKLSRPTDTGSSTWRETSGSGRRTGIGSTTSRISRTRGRARRRQAPRRASIRTSRMHEARGQGRIVPLQRLLLRELPAERAPGHAAGYRLRAHGFSLCQRPEVIGVRREIGFLPDFRRIQLGLEADRSLPEPKGSRRQGNRDRSARQIRRVSVNLRKIIAAVAGSLLAGLSAMPAGAQDVGPLSPEDAKKAFAAKPPYSPYAGRTSRLAPLRRYASAHVVLDGCRRLRRAARPARGLPVRPRRGDDGFQRPAGQALAPARLPRRGGSLGQHGISSRTCSPASPSCSPTRPGGSGTT
jgi:hypothetical protein